MALSIIIISNITIVVVADFLLAASLTVRHGLPGHRRLRAPAPPAAAAAARRGEKRAGAKVGGWQSRKEVQAAGRRQGGAGRARYRPAQRPRAQSKGWQRRQLATPGRGRGKPNHLRTPRGGGRVHCGLHGGEEGAKLGTEHSSVFG